MLEAIRNLVGADGAMLLSWRNDYVASVLDASPATRHGRTIRISRAQLVPQDGLLLDAEQLQRLLESAFASWFAMPIRAACVCFAPLVAGHEQSSSALLFAWHDRSAAVAEQLIELRPLFGALLESALLQRRAKSAIRRLDVIMRSAPQGIVFVDDEHGDAEVNDEAARLLGVATGVVSSAQLTDAMRALHSRLVQRDEVESEYARLLTFPDVSLRDWIWEFADSANTTFRVASIPVVEAAGRGRLWTFEDVSIARRLNRQLARQHEREQLLQRQRLEAVTELAADVAHDFSNILTVIGGSVEVMREPRTPGDGDAEVAVIRQAARRGQGLIRQLLSVSGQLLAQPSLLNVDELLRKIEPLLADALVAPGSLVIQPDAIDARVLMDERQLELALVNLVATAGEAMPPGSVITVQSARVTVANGAPSDLGHAGRWVAIALSDRAERIPATVDENLRESFAGVRADGARPGFGLETIAAMVEQAGGTIRHTANTSTGSAYILYLPEADTRPPVPGKHTPARGVRIASDISELPILVVDDDAGPRRVVRRLLEREGHQVITAESASEALSQLESHEGRVSGVISDYLMPGMSGMELLARIRTQWPELPVVLVSGFTSDDVTGIALRDLRAHFLPKPFTRDELLNAIRTSKTVCREM